MILPTDLLDKWRTTFTRRAIDKLEALIELREILREMKDEGEQCIMQAYKEAAEAMRYSPETLRHAVADLREYDADRLRFWITNNITYETIRTVNALESYDMLNTTPAQILDEAVELGNGEGKTMDKNETVTHALGHRPMAAIEYKFNQWIDRGFRVVNLTNDEQSSFRRDILAVCKAYGADL
jgi:hypothetical protein